MCFMITQPEQFFSDLSVESLFQKTQHAFGDRLEHACSDAPAKCWIGFKTFGTLELSEHHVSCGLTCRLHSDTDAFQLRLLVSGQAHGHCGHQDVQLGPAEALLLPPSTRAKLRIKCSSRQLVMRIPASLMQQCAREFGYFVDYQDQAIPLHSTLIQSESILGRLLASLLEQDPATLSERARLYYIKLFIHALLETWFDQKKSTDSLLRKSTHPYIEQVRNYVLDHPMHCPSIDELSALCLISRKSLYNIFARELNITPNQFVRQLKMERIYHDLCIKKSAKNITEIAFRYGFTSLGRFAAEYRKQFGELPSETLRRTH